MSNPSGAQPSEGRALRGMRFREVRRQGSSARTGIVRVWTLGGPQPGTRLGISVTAARNAVQRNRVRRRLRAILRDLSAEMPATDAIVSAPGTAAVIPFADLRRDVTVAVRRALHR